jgi:hypothetical protein
MGIEIILNQEVIEVTVLVCWFIGIIWFGIDIIVLRRETARIEHDIMISELKIKLQV